MSLGASRGIYRYRPLFEDGPKGLTLTSYPVIRDPMDPKFDFEAFFTTLAKENP